MLQKTRYVPAWVNVRDWDAPLRYCPRSNGCGLDSENTLWKMVSSFGKSTTDPTGTPSSLGLNVLFFWRNMARPGCRGVAASMRSA